MDVRQLRQFVHLAEGLHFGRASAAGNVSPSALSRSIRQLENDVGAVLFDRDNRSVTLTTSPLTIGSNYTITVNRVRDRAATPNVISTNSHWTFFASDFFRFARAKIRMSESRHDRSIVT